MGNGGTWLLAVSCSKCSTSCTVPWGWSLGPWRGWWPSPAHSLHTAPLATASDSTNTTIVVVTHTLYSLLSSQRLGCVHCSSVITLTNALLNIIYSYPASPLRVTNSSNELQSWCGAPHTSAVSSLQTNLNVSVEKCIVHEVPGLFETVINCLRRKICWSLCEAVNEISILFQHQMFLQLYLRRWNSVFIQFVPFRDYIDRSGNQVLSMARLAKDVLAEIPEQLLSFMKSRGIEPRPLVPATSDSASVST